MTIDINGNTYEVEVIRKKTTRNTYIRVKPGGIIYITTNIRTSDRALSKIIKENTSSIIKMLSTQEVKDDNNSDFWYLGNRYEIVYTNSKDIVLGSSKAFIGKNVDIDKWYKKLKSFF